VSVELASVSMSWISATCWFRSSSLEDLSDTSATQHNHHTIKHFILATSVSKH
jgi:hypothetical protein